MEHDHGPVLGAKPPEAAIDGVPVRDGPGAVVLDPRRRQLHPARRVAALAICLAVDAANQDPVQPGVEAVKVAKAAQVPPAEDERFLDGLVRKVAVAKHELGDVEQSADRRSGKLGERRAIACPRPLDQLSLQRPRSLAGASLRRVALEGRADADPFHLLCHQSATASENNSSGVPPELGTCHTSPNVAPAILRVKMIVEPSGDHTGR